MLVSDSAKWDSGSYRKETATVHKEPTQKLFDYEGNQPERIPIRPLGAVSDFVVEQMPLLLEQIRQDSLDVSVFAFLVEHLTQSLHFDHLDAIFLDIATLDLKLLENAIVHTGGIVPSSLRQQVDILSALTNQIPGMVYEEIVLINPPSDMRTFTTGLTGISERDFYVVHRLIEAHMDLVVSYLWECVDCLSGDGEAAIGQVLQWLTIVTDELGNIPPYMKAIGYDMKKNHFLDGFRQYVQVHPHRWLNGENLKGASGAFSATIPLVDLLLAGEKLQPDHHMFLQAHLPYFPRRGRDQLQKASIYVQHGKTLRALSEKMNLQNILSKALHSVSQRLHTIRGSHFQAASKHLLTAMTTDLVGTGGQQNAKEFLLRRIRTKHMQ